MVYRHYNAHVVGSSETICVFSLFKEKNVYAQIM
jgi:hypothetical protein